MTEGQIDRPDQVSGRELSRRRLLQRSRWCAAGIAGGSLLACDDDATSAAAGAGSTEAGATRVRLTELSAFLGPQFATAAVEAMAAAYTP